MSKPIYIYFVPEKMRYAQSSLRTEEIIEGVNVDWLPDGNIFGIEIIDYTALMIDGEHIDDLIDDAYKQGHRDGFNEAYKGEYE